MRNSLRGKEMLCVWRGGLAARPAASCSIFSLMTLKTWGRVSPKGCSEGIFRSTLHLMCFRGKLLVESRGNTGKGVALRFAYPTSPLPGYRKPGQEPCLWPGGSGVLMSGCCQPWGQPHACLARHGQSGGASLAPLDGPFGCCSSCACPLCCCLGALQLAQQHTVPTGGTLQSGTTPWRYTEASTWPRLRICLAGPWGSLAA